MEYHLQPSKFQRDCDILLVLSMVIVLRNIRTHLFYLGYNEWRAESDDAFPFETVDLAANWIKVVSIPDVEIVGILQKSQLNTDTLVRF
jgi:hypothetical protein